MLSRHFKRYSFLPLLVLVFLLSLRTAEACSCAGSSTVLDAFNHSDVVVFVSAVSIEKVKPEKAAAPGRASDNYGGVKSTTMRVEQVFKGTVKVGDKMIFSQGNGADCIWTFDEEDIGKKFVFYLTRQKNFTRWIAFTCGRSRYADQASDDLLYLNNLDKVRNKTRISGTVKFSYDAGESVAGRKIRITGTNGTQELATNDDGVYEIYDLPAGRYFVAPEIPKGWNLGKYWLVSPSLDIDAIEGPLQKIPIILKANKHALLDIIFEKDNGIRGHIYDPLGQPMNGVCLQLVLADGSKGTYLGDCTEKGGAFKIEEIPPGGYVIIVNEDGKMTSNEPFRTFYYPKARKLEEASVFNIGIGDIVEDLEIYPPVELKTITIEGVLLYSDGKPVAVESVSFKSLRKPSAGNDRVHEDGNDVDAKTDSKGRFSIKIVHGINGVLFGPMYSYVGQFENCPKLDRLIKQSGR